MDRNAYQMLIAFNRETKKLDDVYRSAAKSCGISECAFWILYTLRVEEKPFTQAEICEFLIEPKQTVNSALKKLEAEGYLTLSAGADQRSKRVCLTEKGERFVKAHVDRVPGGGGCGARGHDGRGARRADPPDRPLPRAVCTEIKLYLKRRAAPRRREKTYETTHPAFRPFYLPEAAAICLPVHRHDDLYLDLRRGGRAVCLQLCW